MSDSLMDARDVLRRLWEELGPKEHRWLPVALERDVRAVLDSPPQFSATWDYGDVFNGPWAVGVECRCGAQLAIRSGVFTILTVGDYFDGGGPVEDRLQFICEAVNSVLPRDPEGGIRG